jgi:hypothetical protein
MSAVMKTTNGLPSDPVRDVRWAAGLRSLKTLGEPGLELIRPRPVHRSRTNGIRLWFFIMYPSLQSSMAR